MLCTLRGRGGEGEREREREITLKKEKIFYLSSDNSVMRGCYGVRVLSKNPVIKNRFSLL